MLPYQHHLEELFCSHSSVCLVNEIPFRHNLVHFMSEAAHNFQRQKWWQQVQGIICSFVCFVFQTCLPQLSHHFETALQTLSATRVEDKAVGRFRTSHLTGNLLLAISQTTTMKSLVEALSLIVMDWINAGIPPLSPPFRRHHLYLILLIFFLSKRQTVLLRPDNVQDSGNKNPDNGSEDNDYVCSREHIVKFYVMTW